MLINRSELFDLRYFPISPKYYHVGDPAVAKHLTFNDYSLLERTKYTIKVLANTIFAQIAKAINITYASLVCIPSDIQNFIERHLPGPALLAKAGAFSAGTLIYPYTATLSAGMNFFLVYFKNKKIAESFSELRFNWDRCNQ